ncbi:MAG: hypothetical protein CVT49_01530 [candidate division Zixibacteria bacterium HGW-Zixibacteria-1]|nr:MAG: hypothetical protein CVT49_01530 [candidate division Zixibacteria bacterium HGW-Zixibacteria-1]
MILRQLFFLIICCVLILPAIASGISLKELGRFAVGDDDHVFGQSSGNIIVTDGSSIKFHDRRWKVRSTVKLDSGQSAIVAENGLYYAIVEARQEPDSNAVGGIVNVYDLRQTPLWGAFDMRKGDHYLSPSGDYIVTVTGTPGWLDYEVHIYHKNHPPVDYKIEFFEDLYFSDNGEFFLVDCGLKGGRLINSSGELVDSTGVFQGCAFSEKGELFALYDKGIINVYKGRKLYADHDFQQLLIKRMVVRKEVNLLVSAFHDMIVVNRLDNGENLWRYNTEKENGRFVSMDVSPDNKFVACGVDVNVGRKVVKEKRHVQGFLYVYDIGGQVVEMKEFRYTTYIEGTPEVSFGPDGRTIFVRTSGLIYVIGVF